MKGVGRIEKRNLRGMSLLQTSLRTNPVSRRHLLRDMAVACCVSVSSGLLPLFRKLDPLTVTTPSSSHPFFTQVLPSQSGITWKHTNGRSLDYYLPETTGAGCAFIDYDNDGWIDIYLVNSGRCDFYNPNMPLRNALYRNNRDGTFTDVTEKAGVACDGYGMGVAVGDYDGDGFPDIYLTQYGRSILYHNNGDGTFTDVTERAGVASPGWASSAVWFDYDNDGRLDLFVYRFVESALLIAIWKTLGGRCRELLFSLSKSLLNTRTR
jgi:hypothetical protein